MICTLCLHVLKMLGMYLYTLIFGHQSCNMISTLNKLTLQKELNNCVTKVKTYQQQNKQKSNIKTLAGAGI